MTWKKGAIQMRVILFFEGGEQPKQTMHQHNTATT